MYERIEALTTLSVARGVGFAALAVFCIMVGFASDTVNMLRAGGLGALMITVVLYAKANNTSPERYRSTEVWIMLDKDQRPPDELAAGMVCRARRTVLLRWSERSAWAATFLLGAAAVMMLTR
jgi:hypothetical protein